MFYVLNFFNMSTKILNFKKFEISAAKREDAIEKVSENFNVLGDATQAYKNAKKAAVNGWTDREIQKFCLDYLEKKSKLTPGNGYLVTLDPAVGDTRERPYKFTKIKNEGKRKNKKFYVWKDVETGVEVCSVDTNYADAERKMKEMFKNGYKGKVACELIYKITEGNAIVAEAEYTPSAGTKNGTYLAFGVEA